MAYGRPEDEPYDSSLDRHQCVHCHAQLEGLGDILDHIFVCGVGSVKVDEIEDQQSLDCGQIPASSAAVPQCSVKSAAGDGDEHTV